MTDNKVVKMRETFLSPAQYIEQAIASGAGVDMIEKLLSVQERWEANQARKAFNAAIAAFKSDPPPILKNVEVGYDSRGGGSRTSYKHEDLAELLSAVDPALSAHGLWARWKIHSGEKVSVTCIIGHTDGYSEEASTLSAAPDTSGSKNPIQAIGSAVTYLQRYTLKAALGLAAGKDDEGGAGKSKVLSDEQAAEINKILVDNPKKIDVDKFLGLAGALSVSDIQANKFNAALAYLKRNLEAKK